jgi:hypothetical protein
MNVLACLESAVEDLFVYLSVWFSLISPEFSLCTPRKSYFLLSVSGIMRDHLSDQVSNTTVPPQLNGKSIDRSIDH